MITEQELDKKYSTETPHWRKNYIERYICTKHNEPTILIRDLDDLAVHVNVESECN